MVNMIIRGLSQSATVIEVFSVPDDYPMVETEEGKLLESGIYWWILQANGAPDSYPVGPFDSTGEALDDAEIGSAALEDPDIEETSTAI